MSRSVNSQDPRQRKKRKEKKERFRRLDALPSTLPALPSTFDYSECWYPGADRQLCLEAPPKGEERGVSFGFHLDRISRSPGRLRERFTAGNWFGIFPMPDSRSWRNSRLREDGGRVQTSSTPQCGTTRVKIRMEAVEYNTRTRSIDNPTRPVNFSRIGHSLYISHPFFRYSSTLPPRTPPLCSPPLTFRIFTMPGLDAEAELGILAPPVQDSPIPKEQQDTKKIKRKDTELDPLILAAAFASGPHVTRHHHSHDFFPAVGDPRAEGAWDWTKWTGEDASSVRQDPKRRSYNSQQAPRRQRLRALGLPVDPEPQTEVSIPPTELESTSLQAQTRPIISDGTVLNKRVCSVYTIKPGASSQRPTANI